MRFKITSVLVLLFVLFMSGQSFAVELEDFLGSWYNTSATDSITRVLISQGTLRNTLNIHCFGKCYPIDCDWDPVTTSYTGNGFIAIHETSFNKTTLTFTLLKSGILHVHTYTQREIGSDYERDDYFARLTEPDLVIREVTIPTVLITHDEEPWVWVTFRLHNLGTDWKATGSQEMRAKIVNATRDGEPYTNVGYFDLSSTKSLDMGDYIEHEFSVSGWSPGHYTLQIQADYQDLIPEAIEDNNTSKQISFTVIPEHDISGTCRYNNYPISNYTSVTPIFYISDDDGELTDIETFYDPATGVYALGNVPDDREISISTKFIINGPRSTLPGNYRSSPHLFELQLMTPEEKEDFDIHNRIIMHLTSPRDNAIVDISTADYPVYQPGIVFEWDPVVGATEYRVIVSQYRDPYVHVSNIINDTITETSYIASLPVSDPDGYYVVIIYAYNSDGMTIGMMYTTYTNGWGLDYRFKVDFNCYPELPKPNLHVTGTEEYTNGGGGTRYNLAVSNYMDIPADIFAPAPDLAPCGLTINSPRTWVYIYDTDGTGLASFCSVREPADLNELSFSVATGNPVPDAVYMELVDRRCGITYRSTIANTAYPCPLADLNDDCMVDLLDLSIMGAQWLYGTTP